MQVATQDRTLWANVIAQAVRDATAIPTKHYSSSAVTRQERDQARAWLTRPNPDFETVCSLADAEPEKVRTYARARIVLSKIVEPFHQARPRERMIYHNGEARTLAEWSKHLGIHKSTIEARPCQGLDHRGRAVTGARSRRAARAYDHSRRPHTEHQGMGGGNRHRR
jgi:hypothetical protein